jgi:hypothetical protein
MPSPRAQQANAVGKVSKANQNVCVNFLGISGAFGKYSIEI